ncbi:MAG: YihA family ribosome biogenesis GTP-binding protein [Clostridiales bacterium]|nr:YihA family ribosome biogenesis GTP-binding protein [Clostridiales bacterium]
MLKKARFVTSMDVYRPTENLEVPQIALAGKSNVGKSSLINSLTNNSKLAKTSSEPGKTRLINFYSIEDNQYLLVDLPGYGYARASQQERRRWSGMIEGYFETCKQLKYVLQLVDIRHAPTEQDCMMINYLRHYGIPFSVVATKCDKVSRAERSRSIPVICRTLAVQPWEVYPHSSEDGTGGEKLETLIMEKVGFVPNDKK